MTAARTYTVPAISCGHCKQAIEGEVSKVDGVATVEVAIDTKTVTVEGAASEDAIIHAIEEAGYEVAGV
jgi:copper chaperone